MAHNHRLRLFLGLTVTLTTAGIALLFLALHSRHAGTLDTGHLLAGAPLIAGATAALIAGAWSFAALVLDARRASDRSRAASEQALRDELRRTALLTRLSIELRESDDPRQIVHDTLSVIASNTGAANASLILVAAGGRIDVAASIKGGQVAPIAPEDARRVVERGLAGWALRHSRSVVSADLSRDERWVVVSDGQRAGSAIALPISHSRTTLGVLTITHSRTDAFTSQDLLLLEGVAAQAGVAIRSAQRYEEERLYREQALLLFSMSQFLTAPRSASDLAAELLEKSAAVFHSDASALFLKEHPSGELALFVARSEDGAEMPPTCRAHVGAVARRAFEAQEIVIDAPAEHGGLTCVALPLIHSGAAIGIFVLVHRATGSGVFSARVWSMLTAFTNVVAGAFANLQLIAELQRRADILEAEVDERTLQLQRSRDILRVIFDGLPDGLLLIGVDETVLAANNALCRGVLGMRPQEVVGRRYPELLAELRRSEYITIDLQPAANGSARASRTDIAGHVRSYDVDRYTLARSRSGVEPVIERWHDVTNQLELHNRLLMHEQLTTLGRLAASVVHEVGNPVQSVRSCIDLCREDPTISESAGEYLGIASNELDRIGELLERLRQLYRSPQSAVARVDLNELAAAVQKITVRQLQRHGLRLDLQLSADMQLVSGQHDALRQVMLNLVFNAQETMPQGGTLRLSTFADASGRTSGFCVSGGALPPPADPGAPADDIGPRLGLYLSRQVVQQHHGTITTHGSDGEGAAITVTLPWSDR